VSIYGSCLTVHHQPPIEFDRKAMQLLPLCRHTLRLQRISWLLQNRFLLKLSFPTGAS